MSDTQTEDLIQKADTRRRWGLALPAVTIITLFSILPLGVVVAVWYERTRVGTLIKATDGGVAFSYDLGWLASDVAFPVASVLPLTQADWKGDPVIAAFDNLLPDAEGELREKIAGRVGAERTALPSQGPLSSTVR